MAKRADLNLYKYTDAKGAKIILRDLTLLFKTPDLFNDPNDCDFPVDERRAKKAFSLIEDYQAAIAFRTIVQESQNKVKKSQRPIVTLGQWVVKTQMKVAEETHAFSPNPAFRMFIRGKAKQSKVYETAREEALERYVRQIKTGLSNLKKTIYICCFSKRPDSILMWSHYADEFKGVCIEWPLSAFKGVAREVSYSRKKPVFDIYKAVKILLGYYYAGQKPDSNNQAFLEMAFKLLTTKGSDWSYEDEVRLIYGESELSPGAFETPVGGKTLYRLGPLLPKRVFLGERVEERDEKDIREICAKIGCQVVKTKTSEREFAIMTEDGRPLAEGNYGKTK